MDSDEVKEYDNLDIDYIVSFFFFVFYVVRCGIIGMLCDMFLSIFIFMIFFWIK